LTTFVLVHGASTGGWYWAPVRDLLRAAGHEVYTPTLTGLGERSHLLSREIGLDLHIQDVVNVLFYEDLRDVVLAGHSYGGMVVTGVADRLPDRIAHLVYVDAFVPHDGESLLDLGGPGARAYIENDVRTRGDGWRNPRPEGPDADRRLVDHPFRTYTDPIVLRGGGAGIPRTFVWCNAPPHPSFDGSAERARAEPGWRFRELPTWHTPMRTMPRELTELLLEAAPS